MTTIEQEYTTYIEADADGLSFEEWTRKFRNHVVVCLSGLSAHVNGSPIFGCLVYGPFGPEEAVLKAAEIQRLEGGACLIRPLVDLQDTYRRISAD